MPEQCVWVTSDNRRCRNNVLMDGYCTRHLKQTCSICFEPVPSTNSACSKRLSCGHSYHFNCILKWYEKSDDCPVCRKKQTKDPVIFFKNNIEQKMRDLYKDTIKTYEMELRRLNDRLRTHARLQ